MKGDKRRVDILAILSDSEEPVPASMLKDKLCVSRQIIVQDVAILRANGYDVAATSRGYVLNPWRRVERVFKCRHTLDELVAECEIVLSHGGKVEDVFVTHRVFGKIAARLDLSNKTHVEELYRSLASGASRPLMDVTDGYHYHTVTADDESVLDKIESELRARGFLIET